MVLSLDQFNSEVFEIKMANIQLDEATYSSSDICMIIKRAKEEKYDNVSVKVDSSNKRLTNLFLAEGFELVDTQLMYDLELKESTESFDRLVRKYHNSDTDRIMRIAKDSFKIDQFHSDSQLPDERCDLYYEKWAKNLCEGLADDIFVAEQDNTVVGFVSLRYENDTAVVGLAAVDANYRGNGYFTRLLITIMSTLKEEGFTHLYYGTQLANTPVLRTMSKIGGIPLFSKHVMHKMI